MDFHEQVIFTPVKGGPQAVQAQVMVHGRVHGVGYMAGARDRAAELDLTGWISDGPDGAVQAVVEGDYTLVRALVDWCRDGPPQAVVTRVDVVWTYPEHTFQTFSISRSTRQADRLEMDMKAVVTTGPASDEHHVPARLQNISITGFNVLTRGDYAVGDLVALSFVAPGGRKYKRINGRVVRVKVRPALEGTIEIGAAFVDPPRDLIDEIANSVNILW